MRERLSGGWHQRACLTAAQLLHHYFIRLLSVDHSPTVFIELNVSPVQRATGQLAKSTSPPLLEAFFTCVVKHRSSINAAIQDGQVIELIPVPHTTVGTTESVNRQGRK